MKDKKRRKILIAYDGSVCAESAIDDLKRAGLPRYAEALILTIAEDLILAASELDGATTTFAKEIQEQEKQALTLAQQARTQIHSLFPEWEVLTQSGIGMPGSEIVARADEWQPDLIVVGSHGRTALGRMFFGSVSQKLVHEARCSVRVARGRIVEPENTPIRLIIGVDGSEDSEAAIQEVAARHWRSDSEVRVVNAAWVAPPVAEVGMVVQIAEWIAQEREQVSKMIDRALRQLKAVGLKATAVVKEQEPKSLLCSEAESLRADCIFVGARGKGRLERILTGSVSAGVAARAHCSVEIVRS